MEAVDESVHVCLTGDSGGFDFKFQVAFGFFFEVLIALESLPVVISAFRLPVFAGKNK